jgi:hypothetical protein
MPFIRQPCYSDPGSAHEGPPWAREQSWWQRSSPAEDAFRNMLSALAVGLVVLLPSGQDCSLSAQHAPAAQGLPMRGRPGLGITSGGRRNSPAVDAFGIVVGLVVLLPSGRDCSFSAQHTPAAQGLPMRGRPGLGSRAGGSRSSPAEDAGSTRVGPCGERLLLCHWLWHSGPGSAGMGRRELRGRPRDREVIRRRGGVWRPSFRHRPRVRCRGPAGILPG